MSIKLVDTLEPMADFPIAMAENIDFADGKSLQEKYDSDKLVSSAEAPVKVTDGKISLDTVPITKGGTGVTTQEDINKAFINNLEIDNSDVTDGTEFVSSWASDKGFAETAEGALNKPYKRQFIKVWNYIKDKISNVLGLTSAKVLSYDSHLSNKDNPHSVTKSQVGLDSVVNTGDSATPISGGTTKFTTGGAYTELNKKVDKVDGKGLSSNDFTNTYKNKLDNIDTTVTTNSSNLVTSGAVATAISTTETNAKNLANATGTLPVANGGTGATTAKGAQKSLLSDMQTETTEMDDTTEFVMKYGTPTDTKGALFKRSATLVWNYIKDKISSVLGLTATNYGGNSATATSAESANKIVPNYAKRVDLTTVTSNTIKYIKVADCTWAQTGTLQVLLEGNSLEDTLVINFGGGNATTPMLCGHYFGHAERVLSVIAQKGSAYNSNYSIYVKIQQVTNCTVQVALLKGDCTINITESTTEPTNISEWPTNYGLFGTLTGNVTGISAKSSFLNEYAGAGGTRLTSGNIVPKDSSEYGGMRIDVVTSSMTDSGHPGQDGHLLTMFWDNSGRYDSQLFVSNEKQLTVKVRTKANEADYGPWVDLITGNNAGSKLILQGGTVGSNSYTDTNPKLEFKNIDGSQSISLTFTDFDAVQAPASLTLNGNQGDEYFIAPCIKASSKMRIPIGAPSSLEDGCIWIER